MTTGRCCRALRAAIFAATCVLLAATGHILMSGSPIAGPGLAAAFAVTGTAAWALAVRERGTATVTAATVTAQAGLHAAFSLSQALTAPRPPGVSVLRTWADHLLCRMSSTPSMQSTPSMTSIPSMTSTTNGPVREHQHQHRVAEAMTHAEHAAHNAMPGSHATAHGMSHGTPHTGHMAAGMMPDGHGTGSEAMSAVHDMSGTAPLCMLAAHLLAALLCGLWLAHGERVAFRALRAVAGWLSAPLRLVFCLLPSPSGASPRPRRRHTATRPRRLLLASSRETRGPPVGIAVV
ncbi:hypothetical protein [Streptomyces sp. NPDC001750]|uniref:hypothetical protein n=1 Tax=Streptomyces sp. NPDC001750 TaxID=3364607 RepID=UPI0036A2E8F8